jgi:hypothetical protein
MHTNDDHFHTRFLIIQRVWFGALGLYVIMTLVATAWERIAESAGEQAWAVPAFLTATGGLLLTALAVRHGRSTPGRPTRA